MTSDAVSDKTITFTARERADLMRFLKAYSDMRMNDARNARASVAAGGASSKPLRIVRAIEADANAALALIDKLEA